MVLVAGVLAAWAGVLLAALDSPHVHDRARLRRVSIALLTVTAGTVAAGAAFAVQRWIMA
jgi:hypothetical protein